MMNVLITFIFFVSIIFIMIVLKSICFDFKTWRFIDDGLFKTRVIYTIKDIYITRPYLIIFVIRICFFICSVQVLAESIIPVGYAEDVYAALDAWYYDNLDKIIMIREELSERFDEQWLSTAKSREEFKLLLWALECIQYGKIIKSNSFPHLYAEVSSLSFEQSMQSEPQKLMLNALKVAFQQIRDLEMINPKKARTATFPIDYGWYFMKAYRVFIYSTLVFSLIYLAAIISDIPDELPSPTRPGFRPPGVNTLEDHSLDHLSVEVRSMLKPTPPLFKPSEHNIDSNFKEGITQNINLNDDKISSVVSTSDINTLQDHSLDHLSVEVQSMSQSSSPLVKPSEHNIDPVINEGVSRNVGSNQDDGDWW